MDIGEGRVRRALMALNYGNAEIAGGLTPFWRQSLPAISADEQPYTPQPVASTSLAMVSRMT